MHGTNYILQQRKSVSSQKNQLLLKQLRKKQYSSYESKKHKKRKAVKNMDLMNANRDISVTIGDKTKNVNQERA